MIWFGFTIISPFLAFVCWYAKGKGKLAFMLSILILAVLFNMTFVYGWGYFEALSVLELAVFIIGLTVLRRDTLKSSVLMGNIATVYKGNIIKNLIMDCQSYTKYRPNETTGGIFVSWRRKEELPTGA